jgi:hypothetical protein
VCLLSMGSRILARILATRLREWSEKCKLLDDNQCGFRSNRSTADATQIFVRIEEEWTAYRNDQIALGNAILQEGTDPIAILLDITKAYPRVNRPCLWGILQKYGMKERCLRALQGLHEQTSYKIKGREEHSTEWCPQRGLREGCATSPELFNIYHSAAIRQAKEVRGNNVGISWMWRPRSALPPRSTRLASKSSETKRFRVEESLFADDTTAIGERREINQGTNIIKQVMGNFEEKCHDGKEERLEFGTNEGRQIRMLGCWIGREDDLRNRIARGSKCWYIVKKRLCNSKLPKTFQARVLEACVESAILFDCATRPWHAKEIKRLQSFMDRCYRFVWMDKRGGPARPDRWKKKAPTCTMYESAYE